MTSKYQILLTIRKVHAILSGVFSWWEIGFNAAKLSSILLEACEVSDFLAFLDITVFSEVHR